MRIGILGGSFNPAHAGHRHFATTALRRLRLDQVWLLVSPGQPPEGRPNPRPPCHPPCLRHRRRRRRRPHWPPHRRHRHRAPPRHPLHARHAPRPADPLPARKICLAHGGRQFGPAATLARLDGHRPHNALCRTAASTLQSRRPGRSGSPASRTMAPPVRWCRPGRRRKTARMGLPGWPGGSVVGHRTAQAGSRAPALIPGEFLSPANPARRPPNQAPRSPRSSGASPKSP